VEAGGKVLVPVFAVGRAQELLMLLSEHWDSHGMRARVCAPRLRTLHPSLVSCTPVASGSPARQWALKFVQPGRCRQPSALGRSSPLLRDPYTVLYNTATTVGWRPWPAPRAYVSACYDPAHACAAACRHAPGTRLWGKGNNNMCPPQCRQLRHAAGVAITGRTCLSEPARALAHAACCCPGG
jgi:hypothetical protein